MKTIKQLRTLLDMSQTTLSEKTGFSRSHLSEIETGKKTPSLETLTEIVKVFDLRLSQFHWIKENSETTLEVAKNYLKIKEITD
ncbi:MAG: helix-turn-helix domain-containing protein [Microcystaceae cyanobacterium]